MGEDLSPAVDCNRLVMMMMLFSVIITCFIFKLYYFSFVMFIFIIKQPFFLGSSWENHQNDEFRPLWNVGGRQCQTSTD